MRSILRWMCALAMLTPAVAMSQDPAAPAVGTEGLADLPTVESTGFTSALDSPAENPHYSLDELRAEMKKYAWTKGDFRVVPYGFLWANVAYETERSNAGDFTLYVFSAEDQGEDAFHVNARATRLGLNVEGPRLWNFGCAKSGGKIEIDFHGAFAVENKPGVLLRHAYWEVKNDDYRLVMGQTWDVISPLLPGSIMYSVAWGAGNIGYRRAQIRGERYLTFSDALKVDLQGSINADVVADSAANPQFSGDHAGWPVLEGRCGLTLGRRGKNFRPIQLGVSGHVGEQIFDFDAAPAVDDRALSTWSMNADFRWPIFRRMGIQGEVFAGENLTTFLGGIIQGVDATRRDTIYSRGGWVELWYDWNPKWHSHFGYGLDDPQDSHVTSGGGRIYNQMFFANLIYDVTPKFKLGFEAQSWKTLYSSKRPGESVRLEFMAKYGF